MTCSHPSVVCRRGFRSAVLRGLLMAGCAMVLGGCLNHSYHVKDTAGAIPNDYRQRHPITIKETDHSIEVLVGARRGGLTPSQRADVLSFAQAWMHEGTGGIIIDQPSGTPNALAAADAVREARGILAYAGIPSHAVYVRAYRPYNHVAIATVRLNYPKVSAEAGPCGLWPADLGPGYEPGHTQNKPYWNLGCATQRNFAAMVDNPTDLVQPRSETPAYAPRRSVVLEKYRKGESTATSYPTGAGAISEVGR
jgi:pilus assembly protein CpaD